jgi:hypothetical protein
MKPKSLDEAIQLIVAYGGGYSAFDELDFKEYLIETWLPEKVQQEMETISETSIARGADRRYDPASFHAGYTKGYQKGKSK